MHFLAANLGIEELQIDEVTLRKKVEFRYGKILREMSAGIAFGEKALTENSPRTVSIISKNVMHMLILNREIHLELILKYKRQIQLKQELLYSLFFANTCDDIYFIRDSLLYCFTK